jgi:hypothetical protein
MRCGRVEVLEKGPGRRGLWDYERVRPGYYIYLIVEKVCKALKP